MTEPTPTRAKWVIENFPDMQDYVDNFLKFRRGYDGDCTDNSLELEREWKWCWQINEELNLESHDL